MLRPSGSRVLAVLTWVVVVGGTLTMVVSDRGDLAHSLAPLAFISLLVYVTLWRPAVAVDDRAVRLENTLRRIVVPYPQLLEIDTRWALTLHTTAGRYVAWAAPASGRRHTSLPSHSARHGLEAGADPAGGVRSSAVPDTDSGAAALAVRTRWEASRLNRPADRWRPQIAGRAAPVPGEEPVQVRWDWPLAAALVVLLVASVISIML